MDMSKLDLLKLQTLYMRGDPVIRAMCEVFTPEYVKLWRKIPYITDWTNIDNYPDDILDELAYELHVDWYDSSASLEAKRRIIKNSDRVHMYLGTPWAVEQVVKDYFGQGYVKEWHEYGGDPHFFRIYTNARLRDLNDYRRFFAILDWVKRKSQWLEFIATITDHVAQLRIGAALLTQSISVHRTVGIYS